MNEEGGQSSKLSVPPSATAVFSLPCGQQDVAKAIVDGFLAGRSVITVVNLPGVACKPIIEAALTSLGEQRTRIARVEESSISFFGPPISAMDQLSVASEADAENKTRSDAAPDPVAVINRALKVLGCNPFGEKRRLLVIESMQALAPEAVEELARLTMTGPPEIPTQMLFVGDAAYWHRLQAAKFEEIRRRIGIPLVVLPPTRPAKANSAAAASPNPGIAEEQPTGPRRRRLTLAPVILVGAALGIFGLLKADPDLSNRLLAQMLTLWTAFVDRARSLAG